MGQDKSKTRREIVYQVYSEVMSNHGDDAKFIPKKQLYDETSIRTGYSSETVRKMIYNQIKIKQKVG